MAISVYFINPTENPLFLMPLILLGYLGNIGERQNREIQVLVPDLPNPSDLKFIRLVISAIVFNPYVQGFFFRKKCFAT